MVGDNWKPQAPNFNYFTHLARWIEAWSTSLGDKQKVEHACQRWLHLSAYWIENKHRAKEYSNDPGTLQLEKEGEGGGCLCRSQAIVDHLSWHWPRGLCLDQFTWSMEEEASHEASSVILFKSIAPSSKSIVPLVLDIKRLLPIPLIIYSSLQQTLHEVWVLPIS